MGDSHAVAFGVAKCPLPVRPTQILAIRCALDCMKEAEEILGDQDYVRGGFRNGFGADSALTRIRLRRGIRQIGHGVGWYHW